jgi:anti-anti-sigma regulatory factor
MQGQPPPLQLGNSIDIYNAGQLRSTLEEYVQSHEEIIIDLGQVGNVDVVGLQLLCSARKTAIKSGKSFAINNVPSCLDALQETLGLPEDLWSKPLSD